MNPLDRKPVPPPDEQLEAVMWTLRKGARVAECVLWRHPMGREVRCAVDYEVRQTAVQRRRDTAEDLAHDWQQAFMRRAGRYEALQGGRSRRRCAHPPRLRRAEAC